MGHEMAVILRPQVSDLSRRGTPRSKQKARAISAPLLARSACPTRIYHALGSVLRPAVRHGELRSRYRHRKCEEPQCTRTDGGSTVTAVLDTKPGCVLAMNLLMCMISSAMLPSKSAWNSGSWGGGRQFMSNFACEAGPHPGPSAATTNGDITTHRHQRRHPLCMNAVLLG